MGGGQVFHGPLLEDLPDQPHVTERVDDSALQHPLDRVGSKCRVRVFLDWTVLDSSGGQRAPVHGGGIVLRRARFSPS